MKGAHAIWTSRTEEWGTPQSLYDKLNEEFHFTLDPCATAENAKCAKFYTKEQNGIGQDWSGERVFMNPPYGKEIYRWMQKAKASGADIVVCLVHARTDTKWWHENVQGIADEVRFIRGRLKFNGSKHSAPFPSCIVIYRRKS